MPSADLRHPSFRHLCVRPLSWPAILAIVALAISAGCTASAPTAPSTQGGTPAESGSPLSIALQPQSQAIAQGTSATLTTGVSAGAGTVSFQWFLGSSGNATAPIAGATSGSFTTPTLTTTTSYWVRASNSAGAVDSATATITVTPVAVPPGTAPSIVTSAEGPTIASGQTTTLTVAVAGSAPLSFQWFILAGGGRPVELTGATESSYTTPSLTSNTSYWVRVSNAFGSADSAVITITVLPPPGVAPTITAQPQDQSINAGQSAALAVAAAGTAPVTYQWYAGSSGNTSAPIAGASASTWSTSPLTATSSFWVRVSNAHGAIDSRTAVITVTVAPPPPPPSWDPSWAAFEDQVLVLVNQRRAAGATCGGTVYASVAGLSMNANLRQAARGHSLDMATQNYFSHTSLDGRTFDRRIRDAGYTGSGALGENIAAGQPSPQSVVDAWMGSPGHCANIMSSSYRSIGVGYAYRAGSPYGHYWTQSFGGT